MKGQTSHFRLSRRLTASTLAAGFLLALIGLGTGRLVSLPFDITSY